MLKSISISNFRIFKGENRIILGTGETPITAIFGNGGTGKTTIADAIIWCLDSVGIIARHDKSRILNYEINDSLNEGEEAKCSVELVFEIEGILYQIKRVASFIKKDDDVIQTAQRCNVNTSNNSSISLDDFCNSHYPMTLAKSLYFNGDSYDKWRKFSYKGWESLFKNILFPSFSNYLARSGSRNIDGKIDPSLAKAIDEKTHEQIDVFILMVKDYYNLLKYRHDLNLEYSKEIGFYISTVNNGDTTPYEASYTDDLLVEACLRLAIYNLFRSKFPEIPFIWDCIWVETSEDQFSINKMIDMIEGPAIFLGHGMNISRFTHDRIGIKYWIEKDRYCESAIIKEMN